MADPNVQAVNDALAANAVAPRVAEADGVKVEQHPLKDQIAAAQYVAQTAAAQKPNRGIGALRVVGGGNV